MNPLTVIKVGGAVVEDEASLKCLLDQFAAFEGRKVLVHGGGRSATRVAASLGIESVMIGGRRVTDADTLKVVTMVYAGLVNKNIVAQLQARGVNALGLTGADVDVIRSRKRPLKKVVMDDGSSQMVDFGFVGDVDRVDDEVLSSLVETLAQGGRNGAVVMSPLTHDGLGNMLNTNADTIAGETARALAKHYDVTLTFCFEKPGVMRDPDDDDSVIPQISLRSYQQLKEQGIVSGGMLPKLDNAFEAIRQGVSRVIITHFSDIACEGGTVIVEE